MKCLPFHFHLFLKDSSYSKLSYPLITTAKTNFFAVFFFIIFQLVMVLLLIKLSLKTWLFFRRNQRL
ncbi:MAG: hypothetical protein CBC99_06110 [Gammaproteobacteria bacterium TMED139]|nr:MAG: hypothetical protein CBC99_06110 [Gammaproteobacteria bacterium TMED139]